MSTVRSICPTCGHRHSWSWEAAFDKFGFHDGDGLVMTETVAAALRRHGYAVTVKLWGFHNVIITAISRDGETCIPAEASIGYDEPRRYLRRDVVKVLDREFRDGIRIDP